MKHFSHEHELVLKNADNGSHICCQCGEPISGSFYLCEEECCYYLHKVCAELPNDINDPIRQTCALPPATINCNDHDHQLTLLQDQFHEKKELICNICYENMTAHETVYSCIECMFFAHASCAKSSKTRPSSLESEVYHFSHEHLLVFNEVEKINTNTRSYKCYGCGELISSRFYRCKKGCEYYLHKVCAELPTMMSHPMHPQHPLTLLAEAPYEFGVECDMCGMSYTKMKFVYNCSKCSFDLDTICATASLDTFKDQCHMHPLTLVLLPSSFLCTICGTEEKSVSYRCSVCPFWVHKKCTLLPRTVKCSDHLHQLALLPSIPNQFHENFDLECFICEQIMTTYEPVYACIGCLYFAHASCAASSETQPSSTSSLESEINHFSHGHLLVLKKAEKINTSTRSYECNGCREPISGPFYSCKEECEYYLHKVCGELPETMNHPMHPQHPLLARYSYKGLVYRCFPCSFDLDMICAISSHTIEDKCHMHPLTPVQNSISFACSICRKKEEGVSYKCGVCPFWVHQNCTLLPSTIECSDHDHQLTLLPSIPIEFHKILESAFFCDLCHDKMTAYETVFSCVRCLFFAHASCAISSSLDIGINHFSHEHLLVLKKAEEMKINKRSYKCKGCREPISGPFYRCKKGCRYYLHKVCAELPKTMIHPMHPKHPLLAEAPHVGYTFICELCKRLHPNKNFVYRCSICSFNLDMICASASHAIKDKCHMHPLTSVPYLHAIFTSINSFTCNICRKKEEGASYKCSTCPFWVHQNCTLLPATVKCSDHDHQLALLPSIPIEFHKKIELLDREHSLNCDICHDGMTAYETVYSCVGCLFFSHAGCTISSRDENIVIAPETKLLPMRKNWTSLISLIPNSKKILECEIRHFSHDHMLHLLDNDNVCAKMCEACAEPISDLSYGCSQCDYFLHKCCIDLPEQLISHPFHSKHVIKLFARYPNNTLGMFYCSCCFQCCNTFGYKCDDKRCDFTIDLKCASLSGRIKHEAHKHTLFADSVKEINKIGYGSSSNITTNFDTKCSTCSYGSVRLALQCEACSLTLCLYCTMLPAIVNHRYCKCEGFKLRYSPLKDYHTDYYCDLCEETLNPKLWFYHCGECDQFSHTRCLISNAGDSNIKFGKSYSLPEHKHMVILTRFTHEYSSCKICVGSLNKDFAVGFECATCPYFKLHAECVKSG